MRLLIIVAMSLVAGMIASCALADQVVLQEDFSNPFVERDWVYNNSGPETVLGYDGQAAPCKINGDGWPLPGYPTAYPAGYWAETYNHRCVDYGQEIAETRDIYDWMGYLNTDPTKASCYKGALPGGWTAAFDMWGDWDPASNYYSSGRGKMGFTRLQGPYSQSPNNPCLHVWVSHGNLRVASPPISTGVGVYTLSWKAGVWNANTADPAKQYKWTDYCQWGYGYTNWCVWDDDSITSPPYTNDQVSQISVNRFWNFSKDPFHDSDPDGVIPGRADAAHPSEETPGQWHSFSRTFAFGYLPEQQEQDPMHWDSNVYEFTQTPGYFFGFNINHAHDPHNDGFRWGTILNIDDIVLTKKDAVTVGQLNNMPVGSLVELDNMVVVNMIPPNGWVKPYVDVCLEAKDRSSGITVRVYDVASVYDDESGMFVYQIGELVRVVGMVCVSDAGVRYIGEAAADGRTPAFVRKGEPICDIKPFAVNGKSVVSNGVAQGLSNDSMVVTVYGRVNNSIRSDFSGYFYLDDGSGIDAGETYYGSRVRGKGIKVDLAAFAMDYEWDGALPADGDFMAVTGTVSAELNYDGRTLVRLVQPRDHNDLVWIAE